MDSPTGRARQTPRPGTPNVKSMSSNPSTFSQPISAAPHKAPHSHTTASATAGTAYVTAAALPGSQVAKTAVTAARRSSGHVLVHADSRQSSSLLGDTDSDDSGYSQLDSDSSADSCSNADRRAVPCSSLPATGTVSRRRLQIADALQHLGHLGSPSAALHISHLSQDVMAASGLVASPCAGSTSQNHIGGNSVACCVRDDAHAPINHGGTQDALLLQTNQVMQWLGMDEAWFEESFLPAAGIALHAPGNEH